MERSVKIFLASIKSEKTKREYIINLNKFAKQAGITSLDKFTALDNKEIQKTIENYILDLRDTSHPNSIPTFYYPIQTFLEMNDIMINFKKMRRLFPETVKTAVERGWTTEEIQRMLEVADDLRTIATIHFENSSGGRIGLFEDLKIKHLKAIHDEKHGKCYAIIGYAGSKEEYITFLTPEATKTLDKYLESRQSKGEEITSESPVFVQKRGNATACKPHNLANTIYYVQKKAGLRNSAKKITKHFAIPTNHGFRHRFNEIIKSSNLINPHIAERLLSHSSKFIPLDTTYYKPDMDTLFLEYRKIIPLITIDDSKRLLLENQAIKVERKEYEEMKKRLEEHEKMWEIYKNTEPISNEGIRIRQDSLKIAN